MRIRSILKKLMVSSELEEQVEELVIVFPEGGRG